MATKFFKPSCQVVGLADLEPDKRAIGNLTKVHTKSGVRRGCRHTKCDRDKRWIRVDGGEGRIVVCIYFSDGSMVDTMPVCLFYKKINPTLDVYAGLGGCHFVQHTTLFQLSF